MTIYRSYTDTLFACLHNQVVSATSDDMLDYRYSFVSEMIGFTSCGLASQAIANFLRMHCPPGEFLTQNWYQCFSMVRSNESVLGFLVEQMLLSWISLHGLRAAHAKFQGAPHQIQLFHSALPEISSAPSPYTSHPNSIIPQLTV